jgi:hypothetical protein
LALLDLDRFRIINETFEVVKKYAKVVAEKTGEAAHVTRLLIQKATLEHQMAKAFSQLGSVFTDLSDRLKFLDTFL